jgi:hypothetical protein
LTVNLSLSQKSLRLFTPPEGRFWLDLFGREQFCHPARIQEQAAVAADILH